jgi:hypothetical protein
MKTPILALATLFAASALAVSAADAPAKQRTPQQQRMADCSHESKGMKGDAHKKFMSDCLKSKDSPADVKTAMMKSGDGAKTTQQQKMTTCNADAKQKKLKGDERKKFMSDCLKG